MCQGIKGEGNIGQPHKEADRIGVSNLASQYSPKGLHLPEQDEQNGKAAYKTAINERIEEQIMRWHVVHGDQSMVTSYEGMVHQIIGSLFVDVASAGIIKAKFGEAAFLDKARVRVAGALIVAIIV